MSTTGFNPITGRVVTHAHFTPKWGEDVKGPIRKALLEEGISTTEAAKRFNVPHYVASNVRTVLVHRGKLPSRKEIMRETLNHMTNGAREKSTVVEPVQAGSTTKAGSPQARGVETRYKNEAEKWKDRLVMAESHILELEDELRVTKALLKRYL